MSSYRMAPPHGRWIDRTRSFSFTFDQRRVAAYEGDTVASALLAGAHCIVGRSFKLHRPRGILAAGIDEPTAIVDVGRGARRTADVRATELPAAPDLECASVNRWPSLRHDLAAAIGLLHGAMPAGFYYKTFMWPGWRAWEPLIRRMAGLGQLGRGADPDCYDERSLSCDLLVVGGGLAGLQAAAAGVAAGRDVVLVEAERAVGGWALTQEVVAPGLARQAHELLDRLLHGGGRVLTRTSAVACHDHLLVTAVETAAGDTTWRERLWKIRPRQVVFATGAFERPMLFPDNDRPGVMLASAAQRYASLFGVAAGRRIVVVTASDAGLQAALHLRAMGIDVAAVADRREARRAAAPDLPLFSKCGVSAVQGRTGVVSVDLTLAGGGRKRIEADALLSAGGWSPDLALFSQAGGTTRWDEESSFFVPSRHPEAIACVGACAGAFELDAALDHAAAVATCGSDAATPLAPVGGAGPVAADTRTTGAPSKRIFVDLHNDVTAADIELAAHENYRSVEHLKRYTTTGMGTDQGRTGNVNALVVMAAATGRSPATVGVTRFRPPSQGVTLNALAGIRRGALRPLRRLEAHAAHERLGASFDDYGGWERPSAYPVAGETTDAAALREAAHVRAAVGLFDASPLGKLEVCGIDAATFLDTMYVGTLSTLPVGRSRYGLLLNEGGTIVDDGVVTRLGENHFLVNTTSAGAERVRLAFDDWLQCDLGNLDVLVCPVTHQWSTLTVSGPRAWGVLERLGLDPACSPAAMPHMSYRAGRWREAPLRINRASFTGELSYELNVPARHATALMDALLDAGRPHGIRPYGIEALMILRLEKGYLHVGVDTDGTTQPADVGMASAIARKKADFVGRRSLLRPASLDADRLQLVGLRPVDRRRRLPVGAHLSDAPPPGTAQGFVTSSAQSPALGHAVALAMLRAGRSRTGERLRAWHLGEPTDVEVIALPFFDPEGKRLAAE